MPHRRPLTMPWYRYTWLAAGGTGCEAFDQETVHSCGFAVLLGDEYGVGRVRHDGVHEASCCFIRHRVDGHEDRRVEW
jgi:hypothetical protein